MILACLLLFTVQQPSPDALVKSLNQAVRSREAKQVLAFFGRPGDGKYVIEMGERRGGLQKLKVDVIPSPPGWVGRGDYWAVFHTFQDIEEDHDPVYEVVKSGAEFRLGQEVREDDLYGWRIAKQSYKATLGPALHSVEVETDLQLVKGQVFRAPVFRLNDVYQLSSPALVADQATVLHPKMGDFVRAGSLLIPWTSNPALKYKFAYSAKLETTNEDQISEKAAYVTAWWLPSLGRLPFTVTGEITAPKAWVVRGEGIQTGRNESGDNATTSFRCDLPISFPKVIGGQYVEAAERKVGDQTFKIFQFAPIDKARADSDLQNMIDAAAFYEKSLEPLPFPGYECYDSDSYYGIESYSHTLLKTDITHFISHEMGHTYFGGIVPCPYVNDSWNEGVTEYIDSVVHLKNADKSLEAALSTLDVHTPLSDMPQAHAFNGASYWRGCYVMKMLEAEIGAEKVMAGLETLVHDRHGVETRWADLRPAFEKAGGKPLKWFWDQWVDGSVFPNLQIIDIDSVLREKKYRTYVTVAQSGTPSPYRLKLALSFDIRGAITTKVFDLTQGRDSLSFDSDEQPRSVQLVVFPYTLARILPTPPGLIRSGR